jgi:hypothetical protein
LLKGIIRDYTPDEYSYEPDEGNARAKKSDYDNVDVIPVSDPNAATMSQKVVQYQAALQLAQQAPQIYNLPQLHRQMLDVLGIKDADKLVALPDDAKPVDPVSENMNALTGKPNKAFIYQDHDAHIAVHQMFMQDPQIAATIGQNPMAQQIQAAMAAHIAEHLGFQYRRGIEERLGVSLPAPDTELPEEAEVEISRLVAQAAGQLLQMRQGEAAQKQAQQMAQDPVVQMQQQELQLKAQEQQRKAQKDQADVQIAQQKLQLEAQKVQIEAQKEGARIQSQNDQSDKRIQADLVKTMVASSKKNKPTKGE